MELLRQVLTEIHSGQLSFRPKGDSPKEIAEFQPVARRLKAAHERKLIQDARFRLSRMRDSHGQYLGVIVVGGLTFEGEQLLRSTEGTEMNTWRRARSAVKSAQAAALSEPKHLAAVVPLLEDALVLFQRPPSRASVEEAIYLASKVQEFVVRWRPSPTPTPGVLYVQPQWARSVDDQAGEALSLLKGIPDSELQVEAQRETLAYPVDARIAPYMRIFISHSSRDAIVAEDLIEFLRASLRLGANDIRCTSVDGYKLSAGVNIDEQLRVEVFEADVFVALLSPASLKSPYVLFELGARWGAKRYIAPIAVGGANPSEFRSPLSAMHCINGAHEPDVLQLMEDLAKQLSLSPERASSYNKALKSFVTSAQKPS